VREKFGRAAAGCAIFRDWRKIWPRYPFKIDVAFAPRHEHKCAAESNFVTNRDFAFDKGAVAPAPEDRGTDFNLSGERPRKGDLRAEQRR
jgi:hypothetical protein